MNFLRRIAVLEAVTQPPSTTAPKPAFDWEPYDRLFAENTADWSPQQCDAAAQWYAEALKGTTAGTRNTEQRG